LTDVSVSVAQGQRVDKALLSHVDALVAAVPSITAEARKALSGLSGPALSSSIQHAVTDSMLALGKSKLPKAAKDALQVGLAVQHAQNMQSAVDPILTSDVRNQLMAEGQALIQSDPAVAAAYRSVVQEGHEGFQVGAGLMRHTVTTFELLTLRQSMGPEDQRGFDLAVSLHIGKVTTPPSDKLRDPHAQAGYAITHGAQGGYPNQKVAQVSAVASSPLPRVGASVAIQKIGLERSSWWHQLLVFLGLAKQEAA
jgi:hypothetical protein